MSKKIMIFLFLSFLFVFQFGCAKYSEKDIDYTDDAALQEYENKLDSGEGIIYDPLEPVNRVFFNFNDGLYKYVFDPTVYAYKAVLPDEIETGIKNFFVNLTSPIRFVASVFQGKSNVGMILGEFIINSSPFGLFGFVDQIDYVYPDDEDLGQALASWGVGEGFYIVWPIFGSSTARDSINITELALDPSNVFLGGTEKIVSKSVQGVNDWSNFSDTYNDMKTGAVSEDAYVLFRNAYITNRRERVSK